MSFNSIILQKSDNAVTSSRLMAAAVKTSRHDEKLEYRYEALGNAYQVDQIL